MSIEALRELAAARRYDAAIELIRASDNLRLLIDVSIARGESVDRWVTEAQLDAVKRAREIFDRHGVFRATSARR